MLKIVCAFTCRHVDLSLKLLVVLPHYEKTPMTFSVINLSKHTISTVPCHGEYNILTKIDKFGVTYHEYL